MVAMESLRQTFFEDPLYVYIGLAIVELAIAAVWHERRSRRLAGLLAAPLVLAAGVFALEALVVTDREQLTAALKQIARAACTSGGNAPNVPTVAIHLDEKVRVDLPAEYGGMRLTKEQAIAAGQTVAERFTIKSVKFTKIEIEVTNARAETRVVTILRFGGTEIGEQRTSLIWNIHWAKREGGWRILRVDTPSFGLEL